MKFRPHHAGTLALLRAHHGNRDRAGDYASSTGDYASHVGAATFAAPSPDERSMSKAQIGPLFPGLERFTNIAGPILLVALVGLLYATRPTAEEKARSIL